MQNELKVISPVKEYTFIQGFSDISSEDHFWYQWRLRAFINQLNELAIDTKDNLKLLEVGAGTGVFRTQIEKETNWIVDITDVDMQAIKRAKFGRGDTLYYDILEKKAELEDHYDGLIVFDVIEHIEDTSQFIDVLLYHIKPGGYLFVNVPALMVLFSKFDTVQGHYLRYNCSNLIKLFKDKPVEITDTRYWGMSNVPLLLLRKLILGLFSSNKTDEEIYRDGFAVPSPLVNSSLSAIMSIETKIISKPLIGSSVMLAAIKK